MSTDGGRTWVPYDLGGTEPYRRIEATGDRGPQVSALPDGRVVIGYPSIGYWVGTDTTNRSFERAEDPDAVVWGSGLGDPVLRRGDEVSVDGGRTWVPYGDG